MADEHTVFQANPRIPAPSEDEFWGRIVDKVNTELAGNSNHEELDASAVSAVAEINKLMSELGSARDYLSAEAERIKQEIARLRSLSTTAVASVRIISDNLGKWRENVKEAA